MKTFKYIVLLFAGMCIEGSSGVLSSDFSEITNHVDLRKIKEDSYSSFIEYALWPKPDVFRNKCSRKLIKSEIQEFRDKLALHIRKEFLPTSEDFESIEGIPDYSEGDDFLFLRYVTKEGVRVEIQEGASLNFLVISPRVENVSLNQIESFVSNIALRVINYPQDADKSGIMDVKTSSLDIGSSRLGPVLWCLKNDPKGEVTNWYSLIMWWSDGERILFNLCMLPKAHYDKLNSVSQPNLFIKHRKFRVERSCFETCILVSSGIVVLLGAFAAWVVVRLKRHR